MQATTTIPLVNGRGFVLVDTSYLGLVASHRWHFFGKGYAARTDGKRNRRVLMHRLIAGARDGQFVDHINGCRLDNRRANLRICTMAENSRNKHGRPRAKSGLRGVHRRPTGWIATIGINNTSVYLGIFDTSGAALAARQAAEREYFGCFAFAGEGAEAQSRKGL